MKRLFFILVIVLLIIASTVFAQGEAIRDAISNTRVDINEMLQQGELSVEVDDLLVNEVFSVNRSWIVFDSFNGHVRFEDGQYRLTGNRSGRTWGQNIALHTDVVIQVDARLLEGNNSVGYGIMCRANPANNQDGYHFQVRGQGEGAISKIEDGDTTDLYRWNFSRHVNRGLDVINSLTVVCVDDYLALYINGALFAEERDSTFTQGVTGVTAAASERRTDIEASFDNLRIWSVVGDDSLVDDSRPTSVRGLATDPDALLPALNRILEQGEETITIIGADDIYTFDDDESDWFTSDFREGGLTIEDGAYRLRNDGSDPDFRLLLSDNAVRHNDVVIQATIENLTNNIDANAGVGCRANPNADFLTGYVFWIGADGFFTILYGDGEDLDTLVNFRQTDAINIGQATNEVTIVCRGDYLAFYINGAIG